MSLHRFAWTAVALAFLVEASPLVLAHGGNFPPPPPPPPGGPPPPSAPPSGPNTPGGPGPSTPPSGGAPGGTAPGAPASSPGSGQPGAPPASPPRSPGPTGPSAPGGGSGTPAPSPSAPDSGGRTTPASATLGPDLSTWSHWWHLERDAFLDLRSRVQHRAVREGESGTRVAGLAPSDERIEREVVPRLLRALEVERDDDLLTGALIALGRIDPPKEGRTPELEARIHAAFGSHLGAASQAVEESALLAYGLQGSDEGRRVLLGFLRDEPDARESSGGRIAERSRAFAAFALALSAERAEAAEQRRSVLALIEVLESKSRSTEDLHAACVLALGLVPLPEAPGVPPLDLRDHPLASFVTSRGAQLGFLVARLDDLSRQARSHGLVAAARLATDAAPPQRNALVERLVDIAHDKSELEEHRAAAAVALGRLLHSGPGDRAGREALLKQSEKGRTMERRFAMVALARAASRPGPGDDALRGAEAAQKHFLRLLGRGRAGDREWLSIALGVLTDRLRAAGGEELKAVPTALFEFVRGERNARQAAPSAIALALGTRGTARAPRAGESLAALAQRVDDPEALGHIRLAQGLVLEGIDEEALRADLERVRFRPSLLWSTAVALGLAGDARSVPVLVDLMREARSTAGRAAIASALGHVGDVRAVRPLLEIAADTSMTSEARAFALVALGTVCDRDRLPWRFRFATSLPYLSTTWTLSGDGNGLLEIL